MIASSKTGGVSPDRTNAGVSTMALHSWMLLHSMSTLKLP